VALAVRLTISRFPNHPRGSTCCLSRFSKQKKEIQIQQACITLFSRCHMQQTGSTLADSREAYLFLAASSSNPAQSLLLRLLFLAATCSKEHITLFFSLVQAANSCNA